MKGSQLNIEYETEQLANDFMANLNAKYFELGKFHFELTLSQSLKAQRVYDTPALNELKSVAQFTWEYTWKWTK